MIGERIKQLRKMKGYSISELADLAGVSKSYLSYIERDLQNNPSLQVLAKIAAPLETSIEYLLGDDLSVKVAMDQGLDEEWRRLLQQAIDEGLSKGDFRHLTEFLQYKKWNEDKESGEIKVEKKPNIIILRIDC